MEYRKLLRELWQEKALASIGAADVDCLNTKDWDIDTATIAQGVDGNLYIADLAVTEASFFSTQASSK